MSSIPSGRYIILKQWGNPEHMSFCPQGVEVCQPTTMDVFTHFPILLGFYGGSPHRPEQITRFPAPFQGMEGRAENSHLPFMLTGPRPGPHPASPH